MAEPGVRFAVMSLSVRRESGDHLSESYRAAMDSALGTRIYPKKYEVGEKLHTVGVPPARPRRWTG